MKQRLILLLFICLVIPLSAETVRPPLEGESLLNWVYDLLQPYREIDNINYEAFLITMDQIDVQLETEYQKIDGNFEKLDDLRMVEKVLKKTYEQYFRNAEEQLLSQLSQLEKLKTWQEKIQQESLNISELLEQMNLQTCSIKTSFGALESVIQGYKEIIEDQQEIIDYKGKYTGFEISLLGGPSFITPDSGLETQMTLGGLLTFNLFDNLGLGVGVLNSFPREISSQILLQLKYRN